MSPASSSPVPIVSEGNPATSSTGASALSTKKQPYINRRLLRTVHNSGVNHSRRGRNGYKTRGGPHHQHALALLQQQQQQQLQQQQQPYLPSYTSSMPTGPFNAGEVSYVPCYAPDGTLSGWSAVMYVQGPAGQMVLAPAVPYNDQAHVAPAHAHVPHVAAAQQQLALQQHQQQASSSWYLPHENSVQHNNMQQLMPPQQQQQQVWWPQQGMPAGPIVREKARRQRSAARPAAVFNDRNARLTLRAYHGVSPTIGALAVPEATALAAGQVAPAPAALLRDYDSATHFVLVPPSPTTPSPKPENQKSVPFNHEPENTSVKSSAADPKELPLSIAKTAALLLPVSARASSPISDVIITAAPTEKDVSASSALMTSPRVTADASLPHVPAPPPPMPAQPAKQQPRRSRFTERVLAAAVEAAAAAVPAEAAAVADCEAASKRQPELPAEEKCLLPTVVLNFGADATVAAEQQESLTVAKVVRRKVFGDAAGRANDGGCGGRGKAPSSSGAKQVCSRHSTSAKENAF